MDNYFTRFNLKTKLLGLVLGVTTFVILSTTLFFSLNISQNLEDDSRLYADSETKRFASEIEKLFGQALNTVLSLSDAFRENLKINSIYRDSINKKIILNTLQNNKDYLSVWMQYEMKALNPDYNKKFGRQRNLYIRQGDKFIFDQVYKDTALEKEEGLYYKIRDIGKLMITDPYLDETSQDLKGILMVSPVKPMFDDKGEFMGQVGIDLALTSIQKMVQTINPFKSSVAYLVAPNKKIAAHSKDTSLYDEDIINQNKDYASEFEKALDQINQNQASSIEITRKESNEKFYISFAPIKLGEDGRIWALVTETPLSIITSKARQLFWMTILVGLVGLLILSFVISIVLNKLTNRLMKAVEFSNKISNGDISNRLVDNSYDEIGKLVLAMNNMADKLKNTVSNISKSSDNLALTSSQIADFSTQIAEGAVTQASSIEEVVASIEEMGSSISSNTDSAKETETISEKALAGIKNGSKSALLTLETIHEIASKISLVDEISKQTNILALNAAIEAARAGQFGKGFTVVANEVKKLAERAQETAAQIDDISAKGVEVSIHAEKELSGLVPDVEKTAMLIRNIANASIEQSTGAEIIQGSVMELNNIAQKNANLSEQLNAKAKQLAEEANFLREFMQYFKT
ncbi:MAG: methyl-accepting chemotaxis protein [Bacteroidales bacterium]